MSQALAPRPAQADSPQETPSSHRPRKISTACGACKQRKTKCTGGNPCEACSTRRSLCIYDATSDQRRKIANQRNVAELADKQLDLEKHQQLLGGIIATIRAGSYSAQEDLVRVIRSNVDLSHLAAHVRNECRANLAIQQAFERIDFTIDGGSELPSPSQLQVLPGEPLLRKDSRGSEIDSDTSSTNVHPSSQKNFAMGEQKS